MQVMNATEPASSVGIYTITNTLTGEQYIGSSEHIPNRWSQHRKLLCAGKHDNPLLQDAWSRDGELAFRFEVLESFPAETPVIELRRRERILIGQYQSAYNVDGRIKVVKRKEPRIVDISQSDLPTLRTMRLQHVLSRMELATMADVTVSTITAIEKGSQPRMATIRAIAKVLGCQPQDIIWPGDPFGLLEDIDE